MVHIPALNHYDPGAQVLEIFLEIQCLGLSLDRIERRLGRGRKNPQQAFPRISLNRKNFLIRLDSDRNTPPESLQIHMVRLANLFD